MKAFSLILTLIVCTDVKAQLANVAELDLKNVSICSVDRLGNFYFITDDGLLKKYDPDGKLLSQTTKSVTPLTLLEPWNPLKVFIYDRKAKKYTHLDHNLEVLEVIPLEPSLSISPALFCPANEANKGWILDEADYTLKRVNLSTKEIEFEATLPEDWVIEPQFIFMREYQNMVFLLDKNAGIYILNNLGKPIKTIEIKGLTFFNFMGEELCYRQGNDIVLFDLYTAETRKVADISKFKKVVNTVITDERLAVVTPQKVEIFKLAR
ncbi:MAG: hypothetical protein AB7O48_07220 [Cyclobacteriaceae bacterium]